MEIAKNKIINCIESCENIKQLFSTSNMINTFNSRYNCSISKGELSQAYRDKYKALA